MILKWSNNKGVTTIKLIHTWHAIPGPAGMTPYPAATSLTSLPASHSSCASSYPGTSGLTPGATIVSVSSSTHTPVYSDDSYTDEYSEDSHTDKYSEDSYTDEYSEDSYTDEYSDYY